VLYFGSLFNLLQKNQTRAERLIKDKHSSFLGTFVNYSRKKFYNIGTGQTSNGQLAIRQ
jgi:hypothetical protein